jgi:pimeloyl-ACP methyl ester carboxylesterase
VTERAPVVLVHGMGSNFDHNWRRHGWVDMLTEAGREVVGFDMPGHGTAAPLGESGDSGVARLIEFCEPYRRVDLVGFSAGSVLSLTTVVRRPDLFGRVALLGLADTQLEVSLDEMRSGALDLDSPVMRAVRLAAARAGNDVATVLDWAQRADAPPAFEDLARVTSPVLLVLGERDFLGDPDRLLAALPDARLVTLPDTDHFSTTASFEARLVVTDFLTSH